MDRSNFFLWKVFYTFLFSYPNMLFCQGFLLSIWIIIFLPQSGLYPAGTQRLLFIGRRNNLRWLALMNLTVYTCLLWWRRTPLLGEETMWFWVLVFICLIVINFQSLYYGVLLLFYFTNFILKSLFHEVRSLPIRCLFELYHPIFPSYLLLFDLGIFSLWGAQILNIWNVNIKNVTMIIFSIETQSRLFIVHLFEEC